MEPPSKKTKHDPEFENSSESSNSDHELLEQLNNGSVSSDASTDLPFVEGVDEQVVEVTFFVFF